LEPKFWSEFDTAFRTMPFYYFQLVGDHPIEDDEGADLPDDIAALRYAHEVAHDLARNHTPPERRMLRVVNNKGGLVGMVTLSKTLSRQ
jgi:hypothetical protein